MDYKKAYAELLEQHENIACNYQVLEKVVMTKNYNLGETYFQVTVQELNRFLESDFAFVGMIRPQHTVETLALCNKDNVLENITYNLEGAPCKQVVGNEICCFPKGVCDLFPDDLLLQEMGIEGYIGVPLFDSLKKPHGILVALFKNSIQDERLKKTVIKLYANRIGAELEHKFIYESLFSAENKYKVLTQNLPDVIQIIDQDYKVIYANRTLTDKTVQEFLGTSYLDFNVEIPGLGNTKDRLDFVFRTGERLRFERPYSFDSQKYVLSVRMVPIKDQVQKVQHVVYVISDITEQIEAQAKLEESEQRYQLLFMESRSVMLLVDPETGTIIDANKAAVAFYGYGRDELIGMHISNINTLSKAYIDEKIKEVNKGGKVFKFQHRLASGEIRHVTVVSSPVIYHNKTVLYSVVHDITDQYNAEQGLKESELKFRKLANIAFEGIIVHRMGEITLANESILNLTGYSEEELIGKHFLNDLVPEKYHYPLVGKLKEEQLPLTEIELICKSKKRIPVEIMARFISIENKGERVVSIRDISMQKQMQNKILNTIIQTEEQERKRIARELHDGIGPILSMVKLNLESYLNSNDSAYKNSIEPNLIEGIDEVLNQLAFISNKLSPQIIMDYGIKVAIEKFVKSISVIKTLSVDFCFEVSSELHIELQVTLYRVVIELLNNTLKYAEASKATINFRQNETSLQLEYRDNGVGFDYEIVKEKRKGMGLFNIEGRVNSFRGVVMFERFNQGIKYTITIPV